VDGETREPGSEPDEWGDEDDLDALADPDAVPDDDEGDHFVRPIDKFRRTTGGTVLAAGLLGLGDALEGRREKEEVAIVQEAPAGKAPDWLEVQLDFDDPGNSKVVIHKPPPDDGQE
jgi:hypothetical protein